MYAAEMAHYAGKVLAFEANPNAAAFTARVAARNVEVINVALSSAPGRATLKIPLNAKGRGIDELATIETANPQHLGAAQCAEIEMKRLDDFAIENCSFIKIDVEGHEESVLDGAAGLIATQRPVLLVELNEDYNPGGLFLSHGRLHPIAQFDRGVHQDLELLKYPRHKLPKGREFINNLLFIPEEKAARILARI